MKIQCNKCKDIIEGDKKGTYISCCCGECAIDETEDYIRIIGETENIIEIPECKVAFCAKCWKDENGFLTKEIKDSDRIEYYYMCSKCGSYMYDVPTLNYTCSYLKRKRIMERLNKDE